MYIVCIFSHLLRKFILTPLMGGSAKKRYSGHNFHFVLRLDLNLTWLELEINFQIILVDNILTH